MTETNGHGRRRNGTGLLKVVLLHCVALMAMSSTWAQTPDGVTIQTNISYGSLPEQTLNLCLPAHGTGIRPSVVLVHGGGWAAGDKADFMPLCKVLAGLGFVVANINYRLFKVADVSSFWPAQIVDAQMAVNWLKIHSAEYNADPGRVCAYGDSAGAHIATFLGLEKHKVPGSQSSVLGNLLGDSSPAVNCVVHNFGPSDFTNPVTPELAAAGALLVGATNAAPDREALVGLSPLFGVTRNTSPMFVALGLQDTIIAPAQSEFLIKALQDHQVPVQVIRSPGGHEWTGLSQEQVAEYLNEEFVYLIEQLRPY